MRKYGYPKNPFGEKGRSQPKPSPSRDDEKRKQGADFPGRSKEVSPKISEPLSSQGTEGHARSPGSAAGQAVIRSKIWQQEQRPLKRLDGTKKPDRAGTIRKIKFAGNFGPDEDEIVFRLLSY